MVNWSTKTPTWHLLPCKFRNLSKTFSILNFPSPDWRHQTNAMLLASSFPTRWKLSSSLEPLAVSLQLNCPLYWCIQNLERKRYSSRLTRKLKLQCSAKTPSIRTRKNKLEGFWSETNEFPWQYPSREPNHEFPSHLCYLIRIMCEVI